ncbi:MAG: hypothetical protein I3273_05470 [Candidatus Moeniiplasma glomeromycotorum]|nr:hypothetical protein [Candidatus Moeniiplasma glomeromycotorum]MCE8169539.1 hypothetical protein [Candidatus Moeniiplasma glomeromycotorum]
MSELFRLEKEEFSEEYNEKWWTYSIHFEFVFNKKAIIWITITDHPWKKKGREMITKELILELLTKMNGKTLESMEYDGFREPYEWEIIHNSKFYRLFFWFKDGTTNHLWIRNCHRIDY